MKKTQILDARRNIQVQMVSFISIVVIAMVAVSAYLGIAYPAAALRKGTSDYYNRLRFWDLEVSSTLLMDEDDLEALRAIDGVGTVERFYEIDADLQLKNMAESISVASVTEKISLPELIEGRLPASAGECAVEEELVSRHGLRIGDRVTVENEESAGIDPLSEKEYVITGVFRHPDHISFEVPANPYLLVTEDSFNLEDLDGAFMKARILVEGTPEDRFSDEYYHTVLPVEDAVSAIADGRAQLRREKLASEIEDKIRDGQEQLDDAEVKLKDAAETIENAKADIADAEQKLADAEDELADAERKLADAEDELSDGKKKLDYGEGQLYEAQDLLDANIAALDEIMALLAEQMTEAEAAASIPAAGGNPAGMTDTDPSAQAAELLEAELKLEQKSEQLAGMWNDWYYSGEQYLDALTEYENGRRDVEQGKRDVEKGKQDIAQGKQDLADGERDYAEGQADYEDGKKKLEDAQKQLDELGTCHWLVLDNRCNVGCDFAKTNADSLSSISLSFSLIFMGIGALVIYSTIVRMVEEQQKLVGTSKAMGFYNREVFFKYLLFGVGATMIGIVLGILFSCFAMQAGLLYAECIPLTFGTVPITFLPLETLFVILGGLVLSYLAVLFASTTLLRSSAVALMAGPQPKGMRSRNQTSAKRSLYTRLIFRNMWTDLLRVIVTTISIAGCCLLLVCGFNLKFAISRVNERQFGGIIKYDGELYYNSEKSAAAEDDLRAVLDGNGLSSLSVKKDDLLFQGDEIVSTGTVVVADPDVISEFYGLADYWSREPVALTDDGALVSGGFYDFFSLAPGDSFVLYDAGLNPVDVRIAGIFNNYLSHRIFFTPEEYEKTFGEDAEKDCFLVKLGDMSLDELREQVQNVAGFRSLKDAAADRTRFDIMSMILNVIIVTLLALAAVMVYFILMNLTMTYIQRKTRELTVMRVNGFTAHECIRYAAWDLVITTVVGVAAGLFFGIRIGAWIERMLEGPYAQFVRDPDLRTFLFSAVITLFFSLVINGYALSKIKNLRLADIA